MSPLATSVAHDGVGMQGWEILTAREIQLRRKFKDILAEYGTVALVVYLAIFVAVFAGSWAAIQFGWRPSSASGNVGAFGAAYLATKLTQPLRIAATLALTPLAAKLYERIAGKK